MDDIVSDISLGKGLPNDLAFDPEYNENLMFLYNQAFLLCYFQEPKYQAFYS